ncbi:hypothetical protein [Dickeya dadantii]|uniref:hypothetical protein n=1 Tax=Dickeya dadantii TaxID=204038 RepID=UPI00139236BA|nr:hypothetical protein [Dickeya dadantii]NPE57899.1 hypothetical protein [Dickeya dadantii]NPE70413.1 hypothetical protein [Dickeya dadantii]
MLGVKRRIRFFHCAHLTRPFVLLDTVGLNDTVGASMRVCLLGLSFRRRTVTDPFTDVNQRAVIVAPITPHRQITNFNYFNAIYLPHSAAPNLSAVAGFPAHFFTQREIVSTGRHRYDSTNDFRQPARSYRLIIVRVHS